MDQERKKALASLKTARGQIDGIIQMIQDDRYCVDISNQILAANSLLKKANLIILKNHLNSCVLQAAKAENGEEKMDEVMKILEKLTK